MGLAAAVGAVGEPASLAWSCAAGGVAARTPADWLRVRRDRPGGLFLAGDRHRNIVGTGMTSHAVDNVLAKRQREADRSATLLLLPSEY